jgi:hypothetical protein
MKTRRRAPKGGILLAAVAAAAAAALSPAPMLAQEEALEVSQEQLTTFVRAHVAITTARDAFQGEVARIHDTLGREQARAELEGQIAGIMSEHGITPEEFQRITLLISVDAEVRASFEQILSEVVENPQ